MPVSGAVFQDFNANGARDGGGPAAARDTPVAGVTVSAYANDGSQVATTTTGADGTYTLQPDSSLGRVRVEFTGLPSPFTPGPMGADSRSTVQFANLTDATADDDLDLGLVVADEYCEDNPLLATCQYSLGDGAFAGSDPAIKTFRATASGDWNTNAAADRRVIATKAQVGSVYGLATDPVTGDIYAASFMKRHVDFAQDPGTIFRVPATGTGVGSSTFGTPAPFVTLAAGTNPHTTGSTLNDWIRDNGAQSFDAVGDISLGDLEILRSNRTLYVVNMADKRLYRINVGTGAVGGSVAIPVPSSCAASDWKPMGLGQRRGTLYVGGVCSNQSTQTRGANFAAHVFAYDATANTFAGGGPVFSFGLAYPRKCANDAENTGIGAAGTFPGNPKSNCPSQTADWQPWIDTNQVTPAVFDGEYTTFPQPMLSDIEFDGDDLVIGLRDRFGDQMGTQVEEPAPSAGDPFRSAITAGDTLRACANGSGGYALENNGSCGGVSHEANSGEGPGGGKYYHADDHSFHDHVHQGGLSQVPGFPGVLSTATDPYPGTTDIFDGGVQWMDHATGGRQQTLRVYNGTGDPTDAGFGKANGLGDLEARCLLAPVQIGNRVWVDTDRDGVQDANEPAIPGVTVVLRDASGTPIGAPAVTDVNGVYSFEVDPNASYQVTIDPAQPALSGLTVTQPDAGDNRVDNDGRPVGPNVQADVTTGAPGANDHTFDFGFAPPRYDLALRKTVGQDLVTRGQPVTFTIEVFNQGSPDATARNVTVTDYIPDGFEFVDTDNAGWSVSGPGQVSRTVAGPIAPGESTTVTLVLRVRADAPQDADLVNFAEISRFEDTGGGTPPDDDSTPDGDDDNDGFVVDDAIDNRDGDEDDHDPATVRLAEYDLALRKTTASTVVSPGDDVTFSIEVFNQSRDAAAVARDIQVVDYVPAGFVWSGAANPDWTDLGGGKVLRTIPGPLAPGQSATIQIVLRVAPGGSGDLVNFAEIARFTDEVGTPVGDVDSTPDADPGNDGPVTDNAIDNVNGDQDDHDPATVRVLGPPPPVVRYDAALRKTQDDTTLRPGQVVTYTVEVFNQTAGHAIRNVSIVDRLPAGVAFVPSRSPGWTLGSDGLVRTVVPGPIAPGGSAKAPPLRASVRRTATEGTLINFAEITRITDDAGNPRDDVDSTPDSNLDNDRLVDDEINNRGGDEDDHDVSGATLLDIRGQQEENPARPRLVVAKSGSRSAIRAGSVATWKLVVRNRGKANARNVRVCDMLSNEMSYVGASRRATFRNGRPCWDVGTIRPGRSVTITVRTRILQTARGTVRNQAVATAVGGFIGRDDATRPVRRGRVAPGGGVTG